MRYEFDSFAFDSDARQLTNSGREVHLSPKATDLLRILIESRPRVVKKQELHDALWPDTFVVDSSLPVLVRELRMALGDSRKAIRTVHGFGYAFAARARDLAGHAEILHRLHLGEHIFLLSEGRNILGRDRSCDVMIPSTTVSRQHAVITVEDDRATIEDLDSKNGTRIDGVAVRSAAHLAPNAALRLGAVELTYSCIYPNVETETLDE